MRIDERRLSLAAPTRFLASVIERRFGDALRAAASTIPGMDGFQIEVATSATPMPPARSQAAPLAPPEPKRDPDETATRHAPSRVRRPQAPARDPLASKISERYLLEEFLVGDSNRLAYDAAMRLVESDSIGDDRPPISSPSAAARAKPIRSFGPLFIHGHCGLGKTHLLQGIALRFKQRRPGAIVRVVTGEAFTNEFLAALHDSPRAAGATAAPAGSSKGSRSAMERFRQRYRRVDLLCIDDVHFLASKSATQAELLHTFNELDICAATIVLACDEHPRHVKKFSDALISRFMSGMVARIDAPDRDLCERIITRFAERRGLVFDRAAIRALSASVCAVAPGASGASPHAPTSRGFSIRELEGLVTRIEAFIRLSGDAPSAGTLQVTTGVVRQVLQNFLYVLPERAGGRAESPGAAAAPPAPAPRAGAFSLPPGAGAKPVRLEAIISETIRLLGVEHSDLVGTGRHPRVVLARSIIGHLARRLTRLSFPDIARGMGRPSHSTIIAACQRLEKQISGCDAPEPVVSGLDLTVAEVCDRLAGLLSARSA